MKVVLTARVEGLGKRGEVKEVASGYARNFLLPRRLAVLASPGAVAEQQRLVEKERKVDQKSEKELRVWIEKLKGVSLNFVRKVTKTGKLFGSVSAKDIAGELSKILGEEFPSNWVILKEPLKKIGENQVSLKLGEDLAIKVVINEEK